MPDTLPCGHDPRFCIGNPDDAGGTVACLLCEEIGKERERCAKIIEAATIPDVVLREDGWHAATMTEKLAVLAAAIRRGE